MARDALVSLLMVASCLKVAMYQKRDTSERPVSCSVIIVPSLRSSISLSLLRIDPCLRVVSC